MADFATVQDVLALSGATYTAEEQARIADLIPLVCSALRYEAEKVGKDLDAMIQEKPALADVAKLVTVDIVVRAMRQSTDGEPMSQESQVSGLFVERHLCNPGRGNRERDHA